MPRTARKKSESGVYYIVLRSNEKPLFRFPADRKRFLSILNNDTLSDATEIFAKNLSEHAVHLVLKEGLSGITTNLMRLCSRYGAYYFAGENADEQINKAQKNRLFYGRFYSAPLETPDEILKAIEKVAVIKENIN
jgi:hypothetical protein